MPRAYPLFPCLLFAVLLCASSSGPFARARSDEPHWTRITSSRFAVVTDADEKQGHEVLVRFEQMRSLFGQLLMRTRVNMPEPVDIIALRSDEEYAKVAPIRQGQTITDPSFFIPGKDRDYFVLNVSKDESWRTISRDFAQVLLNYNYPLTQPWFDRGFAEYFSSLRLDNQQAHIGEDPGSYTELLNAQTWLTLPDLFASHPEVSGGQQGVRPALFNAQSWIVMHYLLDQNKLPQTGMYFDLIQNQQIPVEEAIQKAYGVTSSQFAQAVKDYFHSLAQPSEKGKPSARGIQTVSVTSAEDVGSSTQELAVEEGQSLVAEMSVRLPERREQALQALEAITSEPKTDNVVARRGLAWAHLEKKEFDPAVEELSKGAELSIKDPWLHYYLALVKHNVAANAGQAIEGLPNMMQDLRLVLNWNPEFAEARSMLAMAQLEGGGVHAAMDSMRIAIQVSPRSQGYLLDMAQIYLAAKDWDAASAMLDRLKNSPDPQVAKSAHEQLEGLPMLKKYGVAPRSAAKPQSQQTASTSAPASASPSSSSTANNSRPKTRKQNPQSEEESTEDRPDQPPAEPQPDKRAIQYLKGRLVAVDCTQAPSAVLTVSAGSKVLKLRTQDYKALMLIGADDFSCEWKSRPVAVNYKAGGKADGDLVSIELE